MPIRRLLSQKSSSNPLTEPKRKKLRKIVDIEATQIKVTKPIKHMPKTFWPNEAFK